MGNIETMLSDLVASLATIAGINTCKLGIEANMTPADYPMIRVVPSRSMPATILGRRTVDAIIYFGMPLQEFDGLGGIYSALFALERDILAKVAEGSDNFNGTHIETFMDEDRISTYKLMACRVRLEG